MELYLLRHAIAVDRGLPGFSRDADRPLTEKGAKKMRRIAGVLKEFGLAFDVILSSPFRRAKETAEIVAEVFECKDVLRFTSHLETGGEPAALIQEINKRYTRLRSILLVGHEPYLSTLISLLVSGDDRLSLVLKKGGICKLTIESLHYGRCATLEWLLAPAQILHND